MSLYNALFGVNPFSNVLLEMLGIGQVSVPRYRDCFLSEDGAEIIIHTRTGGGNRDDYVAENDAMRGVPGFKRDDDDDFDSTYANFYYAVPEAFKPQVELLRTMGAVTDPAARWQETLDALRNGKDTPETKRALEVGQRIFSQIKAADQGGSKIIPV